MVITDEVKAVIENSPLITIVTSNPDNTPHPIIVGGGEVSGDTVVFGIYKMESTQKNLASNPRTFVLAAVKENGPKGYRLEGTAGVEGDKVVFTPTKAEAMI